MSWHKITISTDEAMNLANTQVTLETIDWSRKMWKEYAATSMTGEYAWDMACIISTAFAAGMVQGIRSERQKRKH